MPESQTEAGHPEKYAFRIFACGSKGGSYAADLTSYFIAERNDPFNFISMDVGTSLDCIKVAAEKGQMVNGAKLLNEHDQSQTDLTYVGYFRKKQLNGFLVTHAHLDHTAGLVISSAEDDFTQKPVLGLAEVMEGIKSQFSKPTWPGNFWYKIVPLQPKQEITMKATDSIGKETTHFEKSQIKVTPFRLSHAGEMSSVFLICNTGETSCILFFGDTGPDKVEELVDVKDWINFRSKVPLEDDEKKELGNVYTLQDLEKSDTLSKKFSHDQWREMRSIQKEHEEKFGTRPMHEIWKAVMSKIKDHSLNTIFIECSYASTRPNGLLFGHLTPKWVVNQLRAIQNEIEGEKVTLSVVVTHIKPTWNTVEGAKSAQQNQLDSTQSTSDIIENDLNKQWGALQGDLTVNFIIPQQTDMIYVMDKGDAKRVSVPTQRANVMKPDYEHYFNPYGDMINEFVMMYFGALVFVLLCCFLAGLVFGGGVGWIKHRRTRREKQDN